MAQAFTIPGGNEKGTPLPEASDGTLNWWAEKIADNLANNSTRYPDRDEALLGAMRAEQARRKGGGQPTNGSAAERPAEQRPQQQQRPVQSSAMSRPAAPQAQIVAGHYADAESVNKMLEVAKESSHLVAPATVCGSLPEGCEIAIALVSVDLRKEQRGGRQVYVSGDVYEVGGGKLGLAKSPLERIGAAAAVSWDPLLSRRLDDRSDPYYCLFEAVGYVRNFDGTIRTISAVKEMDLREKSAQVEALFDRAKGQKQDGSQRKDPTAQIREMRLHIQSHAESKAKLRAIRSIGLKSSYTEEELRKPFAVARLMWTGRTADPALKRMFAEKMADAFLGGTATLYGGPVPAALPSPPAAPAAPPTRLVAPPPVSRDSDPDDMGYDMDTGEVDEEGQGDY